VTAFAARPVAFVGRIRRWTSQLALTAAVAAAVIVYAIVRDGYPDGAQAVLTTIAIVAALLPPALLAAFWFALGKLMRLPTSIRGADVRAVVESLVPFLSLAFMIAVSAAVVAAAVELVIACVLVVVLAVS
jgi:hypothetical protein